MARTAIIAFVLILLMAYLSECSNKDMHEEKKEVEATTKVEKSSEKDNQNIQSLAANTIQEDKVVTVKSTDVEKNFQSVIPDKSEKVALEVSKESQSLVTSKASESELIQTPKDAKLPVSNVVTISNPIEVNQSVTSSKEVPDTVIPKSVDTSKETQVKAPVKPIKPVNPVEVNQSVTSSKEVPDTVTPKSVDTSKETQVKAPVKPLKPVNPVEVNQSVTSPKEVSDTVTPKSVDTSKETQVKAPVKPLKPVDPVEVNQSVSQPKQVTEAVKVKPVLTQEREKKSEDIAPVISPIKAISTVDVPHTIKIPAVPKIKDFNISIPEISSSIKAPDVKSMKEFASNSKTLDLYYEEQRKKERVVFEKKALVKDLEKLKQSANEIKEEYTGIVRGLSTENKVLKGDLDQKVVRVNELEAKIANMLKIAEDGTTKAQAEQEAQKQTMLPFESETRGLEAKIASMLKIAEDGTTKAEADQEAQDENTVTLESEKKENDAKKANRVKIDEDRNTK